MFLLQSCQLHCTSGGVGFTRAGRYLCVVYNTLLSSCDLYVMNTGLWLVFLERLTHYITLHVEQVYLNSLVEQIWHFATRLVVTLGMADDGTEAGLFLT